MASMRQAAATNTSDDLQATAVFDAAPVAMLIVESDGRVVMANDELERTFGRPRAAVVGTSIEKLIAPDDHTFLMLNDALDSLAATSPVKGRLIELRFFAGLTAEESADVLAMPVGAVRRELRLAQAWLRHELGAAGAAS